MLNWSGYTEPLSKMINKQVDAEESWTQQISQENDIFWYCDTFLVQTITNLDYNFINIISGTL